jgi:hypothetical protein
VSVRVFEKCNIVLDCCFCLFIAAAWYKLGFDTAAWLKRMKTKKSKKELNHTLNFEFFSLGLMVIRA